jgi:hypothetical protein
LALDKLNPHIRRENASLLHTVKLLNRKSMTFDLYRFEQIHDAVRSALAILFQHVAHYPCRLLGPSGMSQLLIRHAVFWLRPALARLNFAARS